LSAEQGKMSFLEHLEELRTRLIRCAIAIVAGMVVCWIFREDILAFLEAPLFDAWSRVEGLPPPQPLNFSGMLEPFIAYLKLAAFGGAFLASPVILYNLWRFVSPGLYQRERKVALPFVLVSTLLFVGGSLSAYYVVFPIGFRFFLDFAAGAEVDTVAVEMRVPAFGPGTGDHPIGFEGESAAAVDPAEVPVPVESSAEPDGGPVDAGPGPVQDAGPETDDDAGVSEEGDGDGGVPPLVAEAESDVITPDGGEKGDEILSDEERDRAGQESPDEEISSWWEWIVFRLFKSNCRELEGVADGQGVRLRFVWHERKCGDLPEIMRTNRGDRRLVDPDWSDPRPMDDGLVFREMLDVDPGEGMHTYEVGFSTAKAGRPKLAPVLMVKDFLSFAVRLILAFGIIFEMPVLICFLSIAGIVNYRQLLRFSRWFFVIAVVIGAMLTPPDIITQLLLAMPLMVLYFLSVLVAWIFGPKPDEL